MSRTKSLKMAQERYNKKCRIVVMRLNMEKDADIIDYLDCKHNKTDYIRQLIKADMKK